MKAALRWTVFFGLCALPHTVRAGQPAASRPDSADAGPTLHASFGVAYETLSKDYGRWQETTLEIAQVRASGRQWSLRVLDQVRFERRDQVLGASLSRRVAGSAIRVDLEASPSHAIAPRWQAGVRLERPLGNGWVVSGSGSRRRYDTARVTLLSGGIERYVASYRMAYSGHLGLLAGGGLAGSHGLRADKLYGPRQDNLVGGLAALGQELEHLPGPGVIRTRVRSVAVVGRHWLTPRVAAIYSVTVHAQGSVYTRRGASLGVLCRF